MTLISPAVAIGLVSDVTCLPPIAAAEWIRVRAELGTIRACARSEDWIRPTLVEDGEIQGLKDYVESFGGYELLAYIQLALDMAEDAIPLVWAPVISVNADIDPRFWSSRDPEDGLWSTGTFLGGHQDLPQFSYNLIGIEFERADLENALEPYRPRVLSAGIDLEAPREPVLAADDSRGLTDGEERSRILEMPQAPDPSGTAGSIPSRDRWTDADIPERWRRLSQIDRDGVLVLHLPGVRWIKASDALARITKNLGVSEEAAREIIKLRATSGQLVASAGSVFGDLGPVRGRRRTTDGREIIDTSVWQWIPLERLGPTLWHVGDLQVQRIGSDSALPRICTYSDVRFMEVNLRQIDGAEKPAEMPSAPAGDDVAPETQRKAVDRGELQRWILEVKEAEGALPHVTRKLYPRAVAHFAASTVTRTMVTDAVDKLGLTRPQSRPSSNAG